MSQQDVCYLLSALATSTINARVSRNPWPSEIFASMRDKSEITASEISVRTLKQHLV